MRHIITASLVLGLLAATTGSAQSPAQSLRRAVEQQLLQEPDVDPRSRFVGDSAELERHLRCEPHPTGRACRLADSLPVMLVAVRMVRDDSAQVTVGRYRLFTQRCPLGTPLDPPRVAIDAHETRTMVWRDARWVEAGPRVMAVC
jgi:hypothetical protein